MLAFLQTETLPDALMLPKIRSVEGTGSAGRLDGRRRPRHCGSSPFFWETLSVWDDADAHHGPRPGAPAGSSEVSTWRRSWGVIRPGMRCTCTEVCCCALPAGRIKAAWTCLVSPGDSEGTSQRNPQTAKPWGAFDGRAAIIQSNPRNPCLSAAR